MRGFVGLLENDIRAENQSNVKMDIEHIREATSKMQELLDDLLELSRIGRIIGEQRRFSLNEVVEDVTKLTWSRLEERKIDFHVEKNLPEIFGDYHRITEVLQNLVDNSIKFMGNQPKPRIDIGMERNNGEKRFFVKDNGIGIDPKFQIKIFGLFDRINPNIDGTGIGLSIAQRIVEVHGGRIWVDSRGENQGTTFYFTLPKGEEVKVNYAAKGER